MLFQLFDYVEILTVLANYSWDFEVCISYFLTKMENRSTSQNLMTNRAVEHIQSLCRQCHPAAHCNFPQTSTAMYCCCCAKFTSSSELFSAECNHWICRNCWVKFIRFEGVACDQPASLNGNTCSTSGTESLKCSCPYFGGCKEPINVSLVFLIHGYNGVFAFYINSIR